MGQVKWPTQSEPEARLLVAAWKPQKARHARSVIPSFTTAVMTFSDLNDLFSDILFNNNNNIVFPKFGCFPTNLQNPKIKLSKQELRILLSKAYLKLRPLIYKHSPEAKI